MVQVPGSGSMLPMMEKAGGESTTSSPVFRIAGRKLLATAFTETLTQTEKANEFRCSN